MSNISGSPGKVEPVSIFAVIILLSESQTDGTPLYVIDECLFIHLPPVTVRTRWPIDPSTIESVEVLKDASAALYGFKGDNE